MVVDYAVEIVGVKVKELPEVTDDFAKQFSAESVAALMVGVRADLQKELNFRSKGAVRDQLLKNLLDQVSFELPESIVANEATNLANGIAHENLQRGVSKELIEAKKDEIVANAKASAIDRVKAAFVLSRIAEAEKIQVTREELGQRLMFLAEQNNTAPEKFVKWAQDNNRMTEIQQELLTSKVLDFVETAAQVTEVIAAVPSTV